MEKEGSEAKAESADDLHLASWLLGVWSYLFRLVLESYRVLVFPSSDQAPRRVILRLFL